MLNFRPKFRLGQKVISTHTGEIGYVFGIEVQRGYSSSGLSQSGGLSCYEVERYGYAQVWIEHCNEAIYKVIFTSPNGSTRYTTVSDPDIVSYSEKNLSKYSI